MSVWGKIVGGAAVPREGLVGRQLGGTVRGVTQWLEGVRPEGLPGERVLLFLIPFPDDPARSRRQQVLRSIVLERGDVLRGLWVPLDDYREVLAHPGGAFRDEPPPEHTQPWVPKPDGDIPDGEDLS